MIYLDVKFQNFTTFFVPFHKQKILNSQPHKIQDVVFIYYLFALLFVMLIKIQNT